MSWIEERKVRSCWVAVYKVDGKKMVKSTGVPLKQAGKTEKQLRKLAEDTGYYLCFPSTFRVSASPCSAALRPHLKNKGDCRVSDFHA